MYEESQRNKTVDYLENSFVVHNLTQEKNKLHVNYEKLVEDANALLDAHEQMIEKKDDESSKLRDKYDMLKNVTVAQSSVIRNMKFNHLKEKEKLTEERRNLQFHIGEIQKVVEQNKVKLKRNHSILNE
ncbi:hypothetical protein ZWY2020_004256 [Hordeum vulgare]|nr:hypothetical protein ZWY2020_004256 [Hordeum vulgare]